MVLGRGLIALADAKPRDSCHGEGVRGIQGGVEAGAPLTGGGGRMYSCLYKTGEPLPRARESCQKKPDTWNALVSVYESTTGGDRAAALRKWHHLEWESDDNMNSYIERAKTLIRKVKVSGETLTPLSQVLHIVDHHPEVYNSIASTITSWEEADINLDRALAQVLTRGVPSS